MSPRAPLHSTHIFFFTTHVLLILGDGEEKSVSANTYDGKVFPLMHQCFNSSPWCHSTKLTIPSMAFPPIDFTSTLKRVEILNDIWRKHLDGINKARTNHILCEWKVTLSDEASVMSNNFKSLNLISYTYHSLTNHHHCHSKNINIKCLYNMLKVSQPPLYPLLLINIPPIIIKIVADAPLNHSQAVNRISSGARIFIIMFNNNRFIAAKSDVITMIFSFSIGTIFTWLSGLCGKRQK